MLSGAFGQIGVKLFASKGQGALQYALHDQMGGFSPPIFFGRLFSKDGFKKTEWPYKRRLS
jgi:hypothetical protein